LVISKYAKAGWWRTDQINVFDPVGNQRMEGVDDFGWKLWIQNPLEDVVPPRYVPGSLTLTVAPDTVTEGGVARDVQRVHASWMIDENKLMAPGGVHAYLSNPSSPDAYSLENWGQFDAATSRAEIDFFITPYRTSGRYGVPSIMMVDAAGNTTRQSFG